MVVTGKTTHDISRQAKQIGQWATTAIEYAKVKNLDGEGYFVSVAGAPGAWACEPTVGEAVKVLQSVLVDWATLKLADGEDDIPVFGGINLAPR